MAEGGAREPEGMPEPVLPGASRRCPGRALPSRAWVPGCGRPRPVLDAGSEAEGFGADLYHAGLLWEAHEVWEHRWRQLTGREADRLRGRIQLAAAVLKMRRGQIAAARRIAQRAIRRLGDDPLADRIVRWLRDETPPPHLEGLEAGSV